MMSGINDSQEDAEALLEFLKLTGNQNLLHVNLIRYNSTSPDLRPSFRETTEKFKEYLTRNRINATIRKSLGEDIQGACGQLAG